MFVFEALPARDNLRKAISDAYRRDENQCVDYLLQQAPLNAADLQSIEATARELVQQVRKERLGKGGIDAFLYQYHLSSEEGIALMCLAEALLRIPDKDTIDKLLRDKLTTPDWQTSLGKSDSLFVNAATWGLMLTGRVLSENNSTNHFKRVFKGMVERAGEPVIRKAVGEAMRILGKQFIVGRSIVEALKRAQKPEKIGYRFSYDMLGEAARTSQDALRYFQAYQTAIDAIGAAAAGRGPIDGPGISIKLSALHPRYEIGKWTDAVEVLSERLLLLAQQAKRFNMGLTVDAEESDRLEMSLDIIERLLRDDSLAGWDGFGLAIQAYQKRTPFVIDWLVATARDAQRKIMVRLVKGAYWDTEIKDSQIRGLVNYPVYTRKVSTDVSYIVCAKKLAAAADVIYPQFATHNAQTVAVVISLMQGRSDYEFQCLQGMGRALYDSVVVPGQFQRPCRIYAPVGSHEDLLPYLVRRLLENGANTSFVNRIVDEASPIEDLVADPITKLASLHPKPHPRIPLPKDIYGAVRQNSAGIDFSDIQAGKQLKDQLDEFARHYWHAAPTLETPRVKPIERGAKPPVMMPELESVSDEPLASPQDARGYHERVTKKVSEPRQGHQVVGEVIEGTAADADQTLARARAGYATWHRLPVTTRANCLRQAADLFEKNGAELIALAVREAGKTVPDALAELREAVDFCRYYADQAERALAPQELVGPTGESNSIQLVGRGVVACISPWNFPLAIFTGQVVAALAAGNAVVAKPAAQTPLIGARAVELLHQAGVPKDVLQLLPGRGSVIGDRLVSDERVNAILFTGSTETARHINQTLAARQGPLVPFIAETGGQNAMIADSSALPEQLVVDVMTSAFYSAGQRCSCLRVLFVQTDIADKVITLLKGAMAQLKIGNPALLSTDIGPVIDESSRKTLIDHTHHLDKIGRLIYRVELDEHCEQGTFFAPCAYEIDRIDQLEREVFGPILHVIRFRGPELPAVLDAINNTGYGLTLGIHTRIDSTAAYVNQRACAGNVYVNRNMIGAVVGVQPFGGEGLSGTGPKAGGPHYLPRLCVERTLSINTAATGGNATLLSLGD
jgi:RHH-type proline utilization regulon transcriptional repressor/proline dehydrogenase/delta 1-pyrroline-5-carboxylate dehydrogenase